MKYYDKKLYKMEQRMKTELFILIVFIIAFILGFFVGTADIYCKDNTIKQLQIETDNVKK